MGCAGVVVLLCLIVHFVFPDFVPFIPRRRFLARWEKLLTEARNPEDLQRQISKNEWSIIWTKRFRDGSWVIARGESTAGGDVFDATILADSNRAYCLVNFIFRAMKGWRNI